MVAHNLREAITALKHQYVRVCKKILESNKSKKKRVIPWWWEAGVRDRGDVCLEISCALDSYFGQPDHT